MKKQALITLLLLTLLAVPFAIKGKPDWVHGKKLEFR